MKNPVRVALFMLPALFSFFSSCAQLADKNKMAAVVQLPAGREEKIYQGSSITIPAGWQVSEAGNCSELSFISWDPSHPARQIFYYGLAPIFYLSAQQRQMDNSYVAMGGMRTPLTGHPVINPATPENYIRNFFQFLDLPDLRAMQKLPEMYNVEVISVVPQQSYIQSGSSNCALVRALFTDRNKRALSEGLFLVTMVPFRIAASGPGASFGLPFSFTGITAPFGELDALLGPLNGCLQSFTIDQNYMMNCMQQSNNQTIATLKAGKTLAEASSSITKAWENKSRSEDLISQKRSDAMMGRQRLYDPQTGTVYQVDNTFTNRYNLEPGKYNLKNLQQLPPDDLNLWKQPMVNGADHIIKVN